MMYYLRVVCDKKLGVPVFLGLRKDKKASEVVP
jgi:hypothetical protein